MDVDALARHIVESRQIRSRIVVLCEGDILPARPEGTARSPAWYRRLDVLPDSSFYKMCVPHNWRTRGLSKPCFFNCGGRGQVLDTYQRVLALHGDDPEQSYLSPDRLFALLDWDLQPQTLAGYRFAPDTEALWAALAGNRFAPDTEALWAALYQHQDVQRVDARHRVWVTRLIHKEAFFLLSNVAHVLLEHVPAPQFGDRAFATSAVWDAALQSIRQRAPHPDRDLATHVQIAQGRLQVAGLPPAAVDTEAIASALEAARAAGEEATPFENALWSVTKAKPHWEAIRPVPHPGGEQSPAQYRDNLAQLIANAIAAMAPGDHPVAAFFAWLEQHA